MRVRGRVRACAPSKTKPRPNQPKPAPEEGSRESVDAGCRRLTASWTRARAERDPSVELCDFFEAHEAAGQEALLPPGGGDCFVPCQELVWFCGRVGHSRCAEPARSFRGSLTSVPRSQQYSASSAPVRFHPPFPQTPESPGVYTLHDLRAYGRKRGWCPYFTARHMMAFANVIVYNYQYMLDPKVSQVCDPR